MSSPHTRQRKSIFSTTPRRHMCSCTLKNVELVGYMRKEFAERKTLSSVYVSGIDGGFYSDSERVHEVFLRHKKLAISHQSITKSPEISLRNARHFHLTDESSVGSHIYLICCNDLAANITYRSLVGSRISSARVWATISSACTRDRSFSPNPKRVR